MVVVSPSGNWVRAVRDFVQQHWVSRCELCGTTIPEGHLHLVDIAERRIVCACVRCENSAVSHELYRWLPTQWQRLRNFLLTDADWEDLQIPIGLAFIFHSTPSGRPVALYPGPAGVTESLLKLERWSGLVDRNPVLATLAPDVEALLIDRTQGRRDYYRVPIDRCYALAGLIRKHWRGLSGGSEAWAAIYRFFQHLRDSGDFAHG